MGESIRLQPSDDTLMVFDGTVLEVFPGGRDSWRIHALGLEGIEITEGLGRSFHIKNRFGPDYGVGYDKELLPELRDFADTVLKAVAQIRG